MEKRRFLVADDTSIFATPQEIVAMYGEYAQDERYGFAGIEGMGWITCMLFLVQARKHNIAVPGVHGRLGNVHGPMSRSTRLKRALVERFLLSTRTLIGIAKIFQLSYILVHVSEAQANFELLKSFRGQVRIENDIVPGYGQDEAIGITRSLARWCDAVYNPDTVHRAIETGRFTSANEVVRLGTEEMRALVQEESEGGSMLIQSDHQAIGEVEDDSFDTLLVDEDLLQERGELYSKNLHITTVFENQQKSGKIKMTPEQFARARAKTIRKMHRLQRTGWLRI